MAGLFLIFVEQEASERLLFLVTLGELEATLKWFKKDKILGPDDWSIEFYLAFFDILGNDLVQVTEECRKGGRMYDAFNSTFIALIPKNDDP